MLAMSDASGMVEASLPGLARQARKTKPQTLKALSVLQSPDADSKNPDHEGRRVAKVEGGWLILNYSLYRAQQELSQEPEAIATRERVQRYRDRKRKAKEQALHPVTGNASVTLQPLPTVTGVTSASACVPASACTKEEDSKEKPNLVPTASDIYQAYPRHEAKVPALSAIEKAIRKGFGRAFLLERTIAYAKTQPPRSRFTPLPASWFNAERFNDDPKEWVREERPAKPDPRQERLDREFEEAKRKYG